MRGEVIGVNTTGLVDSQNLNFAVSVLHVADLVRNRWRLAVPWSLLPAPRSSNIAANADAQERQQQEQTEERTRQAATEVEQCHLDAQRQQDEQAAAARQAQQAQATQLDLSRLNSRIVAIRAELAGIEQQGVDLTAQRRAAFAKAAAVDAAGQQVAQQIGSLQNQIAGLTSSIDGRKINGVIYLSGMDEAFNDLRNQRQFALSRIPSLQQQYGRLQAEYAGLDADARQLLTQIEYLSQQRSDRTAELRSFEQQYNAILQAAK